MTRDLSLRTKDDDAAVPLDVALERTRRRHDMEGLMWGDAESRENEMSFLDYR